MSRKIIYCLRTQNELTDLIPNITAALPYVDKVICLDGGSQDLTVPYMRNWANQEPKIHFEIDVWRDDFPAARNEYLKRAALYAQEGDWLTTADPDEFYMPETWEKLHRAIDRAERDGCNMIGLQCRSVSMDGPKRVWENLDDYWKELIVKWDPNFYYSGFKCHEGKAGVPHNILKTGLLYEHRKQSNITWIRGCRNLWTAGGGPNLGNENPAWQRFRSITDNLGLKTWNQVVSYLVKGNISQDLKQFFIDHMFEGMNCAGPRTLTALYPERFPIEWDGASEMREGYKAYFRQFHPEEEPQEFRGVEIK